MPQFSAEIVAKLLNKARPNLLVAVPTLYDALTKTRRRPRATVLPARVFSGTDTLPRPVEERRLITWVPPAQDRIPPRTAADAIGKVDSQVLVAEHAERAAHSPRQSHAVNVTNHTTLNATRTGGHAVTFE